MKVECPKCGKIIQKKIGTYWYRESGLDNVYLKNVTVYECSCGTTHASIFRVVRLNELIAETLLEKPALLNGKEIQFLRKNIFLSSKAFSAALGLEKTTLSKWENDRQQHNEMHDRLIRGVYIIHKGIGKEKAQRIFNLLGKIRLRKSDIINVITAEKHTEDYVVSWRPVLETQIQEFTKVWASSEEFFKPFTLPQIFIANISKITSRLSFSSQETLQTKTNLYALEVC